MTIFGSKMNILQTPKNSPETVHKKNQICGVVLSLVSPTFS